MSQTFEGKSVDDALEQAAKALGADKSELQHEVVEEKTDDFWGLGEKVFVVKAWVEGAEEPEPEPEPEPQPERATVPAPAEDDSEDDDHEDDDSEDDDYDDSEDDDSEDYDEPAGAQESISEPQPRRDPVPSGDADIREIEPGVVAASPDDVPSDQPTILATQEDIEDGDLAEAAVALLAKIFDAMGFECEAQAKMEGDTLQVAISGQDNQFLLDGRGRGLSALELILNHAFRHRTDGGRKKVRVDAGDFRSQRDDELRDMAYQVAHRAKETGEVQQTPELNPYERRIVHLTLAEDSRITTRSEGNGFLKAVNVIPSNSGGRGGRRGRG